MTKTPVSASNMLTIGIVGFGNFGQFLARFFAAQGHRIIGMSRSDLTEKAASLGCEYVRSGDDLMDKDPQVVIFSTSIMSLDSVLAKFPTARLSGVLVVDVLSVKLYAQELLMRHLPSDADIVCTHPMFGPESGRDSWKDLPFVYDRVRVSPRREQLCERFLTIWEYEGCKMVPMSCSQHDAYAASTQFITHTTGRLLNEVGVESTPINTKGYESLLGVVDTTCKDSDDLYFGLFKYNPKARAQLDKLESAIQTIRAKLEKTEADEARQSKKVYVWSGKRYPSFSEEVLQSLIRVHSPL